MNNVQIRSPDVMNDHDWERFVRVCRAQMAGKGCLAIPEAESLMAEAVGCRSEAHLAEFRIQKLEAEIEDLRHELRVSAERYENS